MVCHIRFDYRLLLSAICNIRYEYSLNLSPRIHSRKKCRERGQMVSPTIDLRQQMVLTSFEALSCRCWCRCRFTRMPDRFSNTANVIILLYPEKSVFSAKMFLSDAMPSFRTTTNFQSPLLVLELIQPHFFALLLKLHHRNKQMFR